METTIIPVLHSLDTLLNRFDELSQRHTSLVSHFETNISDIENPLHNVARDEDEQRKTLENLSKTPTTEYDERKSSRGTLEDFYRNVTKNRLRNRPPSYSSNDSSSFYHRIPSRSSWTTSESLAIPHRPIMSMTESTSRSVRSQPVTLTANGNVMERKSRVPSKSKPKILPQNPPVMRRNAHSAIKTFTIETINRLSTPRKYRELPEPRITSKRVSRRPRSFQPSRKEGSLTSATSNKSVPLQPSPPPPLLQSVPSQPSLLDSASLQTKRINPAKRKSSTKKLRAENRVGIDDSKQVPTSISSRSTVFLAPPPTICLTFPMQQELQSVRVPLTPKTKTVSSMSPKKSITIFTNKKTLITSNRMMYLIT